MACESRCVLAVAGTTSAALGTSTTPKRAPASRAAIQAFNVLPGALRAFKNLPKDIHFLYKTWL